MPFTRNFIEKCGDVWEKSQNHLFVNALGEGSLDAGKFKFYLKQDYLYLIAYSRVLALAVYKAPNLELMNEFAKLLSATLSTEMALHRAYAAKFGIPEAQLEAEPPSPAMLAYTSYMLDIAARESFAANVACLLPCAIGYAEIGERLLRESQAAGALESNPYREWIETYSSREFRDYSDWLEKTFDGLAAEAGESETDRLFEIFLTSTKYEWMFWEMAWTMEEWPA